MNFQLITLILSSIVALSYVTTVWIKYGIQKSISTTFYELPYDRKLTFRLFMFSLSIGIIIGGNLPLFYVSGILLSLVGIFTRIKVKWKKIIHLIGAIGGIVFAYIGLIYYYNLWIESIIVLNVCILFIFIDRKNIIWWSELVSMLNILVALYVFSFI
jgi:hypothetical protein